jgi:hypothetical protein
MAQTTDNDTVRKMTERKSHQRQDFVSDPRKGERIGAFVLAGLEHTLSGALVYETDPRNKPSPGETALAPFPEHAAPVEEAHALQVEKPSGACHRRTHSAACTDLKDPIIDPTHLHTSLHFTNQIVV